MDERYRNFEKIDALIGGMSLQERINALVTLGEKLSAPDENLDAVMRRSYFDNKWFTEENQQQSISAICNSFLEKQKLNDWLLQYTDLQAFTLPMKNIGIVMAGNIPLVGFHDALCVFVAGHCSLIKISDKDKYLLPYIVALLEEIDSRTTDYFSFTERFTDFQGVIATGSNNSARYFEAYFGKYPNIIRKNRNSVAVLNGEETDEDLLAIGHDIFDYFGLGCRNVSKLYVPEGYDFDRALNVWHENFKEMVMHDKYKNNFDYNFALYMLNRIKFHNNGCVIVWEEKTLSSRIASLHYEVYKNTQDLENELLAIENQLQCVSTIIPFTALKTVAPGITQSPTLNDYADNVDVMKWLLSAV